MGAFMTTEIPYRNRNQTGWWIAFRTVIHEHPHRVMIKSLDNAVKPGAERFEDGANAKAMVLGILSSASRNLLQGKSKNEKLWESSYS